MQGPKTLLEAARYFADIEVCEAYMRSIRWPDGNPVCPACGAKGDRIGAIRTRRTLRCKDCRKQFSHKVGTIFQDSPLGLDKWFVAIWSIANCRNGISSHELGRAIGVTQKTAWFMLHRIRKAMEISNGGQFVGPAEADTTYVGGRAANMHTSRREKIIKGRGAVGKTPVHGVLQRGTETAPSQVRALALGREDAETVLREVRRHVRLGAPVYTDESRAYAGLVPAYLHAAVDHSKRYALREVHTNGLENFWSLFKRGIRGTYVSIAPFHLFRYVSEQVFRFNERLNTDADRFRVALSRVFGRRLTWRVLCGIDGAGFMGLE